MTIDFEELIRQIQWPKIRNQNLQPTGGQAVNAQQAALRAPPRYSRGKAAWAAFSRLWCGAARQDLTRGSVPVPWYPVLPINILEFPKHEGGGVLMCF